MIYVGKYFSQYMYCKFVLIVSCVIWKMKTVQSICTHFSSLSGQPDIFEGLEHKKNQVQNMDLKKLRLSPLLFLNNNYLCFSRAMLRTWFFSGSQTDPCFQNKNSGMSGCRLTVQMRLSEIFSFQQPLDKSWKIDKRKATFIPDSAKFKMNLWGLCFSQYTNQKFEGFLPWKFIKG